MASTNPYAEPPADSAANPEIASDSLATGVSFSMLIAVAQRGVGFARTAIFCRLLPEQELGQWSLVFSFLMLAAPFTLLGITGSFGRYVEHYYQRGLIQKFFLRTGQAVVVVTSLALFAIWCFQDQVAWSLFGSVQQKHLLLPACLTLVTTILYNYFLEASIALRRIRVGSMMELTSSWTFATVSVAFLFFSDWGAYGVILGFASGNLAGAAFAAVCLWKIWPQLPSKQAPFPHLSLWIKLAPFAIGLWGMNLITNLFEISDRGMIVHFSGLNAGGAQALVGQYFSSLAVPTLMVGVSNTLSHMFMPYLSQDWEQGRRDAVSQRLNLAVKMLGVMLCAAATGILCVAPLLFHVVFDGKYALGFAILPIIVAFCYYRSIVQIGYNYLFCIEKTRFMCLSLGTALLLNVGLNAILLPRLGLAGAALASASSSALNLIVVFVVCRRWGHLWDRGVLWFLLFPLVFSAGTIATLACFTTLGLVCIRTTWIFDPGEKQQILEASNGLLAKFLPRRREPAAGDAAC